VRYSLNILPSTTVGDASPNEAFRSLFNLSLDRPHLALSHMDKQESHDDKANERSTESMADYEAAQGSRVRALRDCNGIASKPCWAILLCTCRTSSRASA
jgi:hypothetical protein